VNVKQCGQLAGLFGHSLRWALASCSPCGSTSLQSPHRPGRLEQRMRRCASSWTSATDSSHCAQRTGLNGHSASWRSFST